MQMTSLIFFGFLAVVFILLYGCCHWIQNEENCIKRSNEIVLAASYVFILYADVRFALVLLILSVVTWYFARDGKQPLWGILFSLVILGFFKYTQFFLESFQRLFGKDPVLLHLILPLGISFYTFSAISYLMDCKRGKVEAKPFLEVALYLAFFPKLTSGPIQRSGDFFGQLSQKRLIGWARFSEGIQIFSFGLFKKIVLADRLTVFVDQVYATPKAFGSFTVFLATIAYSFQIYFDFSGYSDMAIGTAKILGFDLPRNFNLPYVSHNVTELWKRWHISLSSWLQDYLYISLGGNRRGTVRTYLNLVLTMVLGGIWHGANWTYVIWGLLHGLALAVHKCFMQMTGSARKTHNCISNTAAIIVTFFFTDFCWIFFRAESMKHAWQIIRRMLSFERGIEQPYIWLFAVVLIYLSGWMYAYKKTDSKCGNRKQTNLSYTEGQYLILDLTKFWNLVGFFIFLGLILGLAYTGGSPFIYGNY